MPNKHNACRTHTPLGTIYKWAMILLNYKTTLTFFIIKIVIPGIKYQVNSSLNELFLSFRYILSYLIKYVDKKTVTITSMTLHLHTWRTVTKKCKQCGVGQSILLFENGWSYQIFHMITINLIGIHSCLLDIYINLKSPPMSNYSFMSVYPIRAEHHRPQPVYRAILWLNDQSW